MPNQDLAPMPDGLEDVTNQYVNPSSNQSSQQAPMPDGLIDVTDQYKTNTQASPSQEPLAPMPDGLEDVTDQYNFKQNELADIAKSKQMGPVKQVLDSAGAIWNAAIPGLTGLGNSVDAVAKDAYYDVAGNNPNGLSRQQNLLEQGNASLAGLEGIAGMVKSLPYHLQKTFNPDSLTDKDIENQYNDQQTEATKRDFIMQRGLQGILSGQSPYEVRQDQNQNQDPNFYRPQQIPKYMVQPENMSTNGTNVLAPMPDGLEDVTAQYVQPTDKNQIVDNPSADQTKSYGGLPETPPSEREHQELIAPIVDASNLMLMGAGSLGAGVKAGIEAMKVSDLAAKGLQFATDQALKPTIGSGLLKSAAATAEWGKGAAEWLKELPSAAAEKIGLSPETIESLNSEGGKAILGMMAGWMTGHGEMAGLLTGEGLHRLPGILGATADVLRTGAKAAMEGDGIQNFYEKMAQRLPDGFPKSMFKVVAATPVGKILTAAQEMVGKTGAGALGGVINPLTGLQLICDDGDPDKMGQTIANNAIFGAAGGILHSNPHLKYALQNANDVISYSGRLSQTNPEAFKAFDQMPYHAKVVISQFANTIPGLRVELNVGKGNTQDVVNGVPIINVDLSNPSAALAHLASHEVNHVLMAIPGARAPVMRELLGNPDVGTKGLLGSYDQGVFKPNKKFQSFIDSYKAGLPDAAKANYEGTDRATWEKLAEEYHVENQAKYFSGLNDKGQTGYSRLYQGNSLIGKAMDGLTNRLTGKNIYDYLDQKYTQGRINPRFGADTIAPRNTRQDRNIVSGLDALGIKNVGRDRYNSNIEYENGSSGETHYTLQDFRGDPQAAQSLAGGLFDLQFSPDSNGNIRVRQRTQAEAKKLSKQQAKIWFDTLTTKTPSTPKPLLTPEAVDLLKTVDSGGAAPAFISKNLERIANENGVKITGSMTPKNVIDSLRAKNSQVPAEGSSKINAKGQLEARFLTDDEINKLVTLNGLNKSQEQIVRQLSNDAQSQNGKINDMTYFTATKESDRSKYASLGTSTRPSAFYGFVVSKKGAVLAQMIDLEQLKTNFKMQSDKLLKAGKNLPVQGHDVEQALQDYLKNHELGYQGDGTPVDSANPPSEPPARVFSKPQKNFLNELFGIATKPTRHLNDLWQIIEDEGGKHSSSVFKAFRIDRLSKVEEPSDPSLIGKRMPFDYYKVNQNFSPNIDQNDRSLAIRESQLSERPSFVPDAKQINARKSFDQLVTMIRNNPNADGMNRNGGLKVGDESLDNGEFVSRQGMYDWLKKNGYRDNIDDRVHFFSEAKKAANDPAYKSQETPVSIPGHQQEIEKKEQIVNTNKNPILSRGGYSQDFSKSNRANLAESEGRYPATQSGKILGLPSKFIKDVAGFASGGEYHHTSKFYNSTTYYDTDLIKRWMENDPEILEDRGETFKQAFENWKTDQAKAKSIPNKIHENQTVKWLEWGGTRNHPIAKERKVDGATVIDSGGKMLTIKLPDGTIFKKGRDTKGFDFQSNKELKFIAKEQRKGSGAYSIYEDGGKLRGTIYGKNQLDAINKAVSKWGNEFKNNPDIRFSPNVLTHELVSKNEQEKGSNSPATGRIGLHEEGPGTQSKFNLHIGTNEPASNDSQSRNASPIEGAAKGHDVEGLRSVLRGANATDEGSRKNVATIYPNQDATEDAKISQIKKLNLLVDRKGLRFNPDRADHNSLTDSPSVEHDVFLKGKGADSDRVFKITKGNSFGMTPRIKNGKIVTERATPEDYLNRIALTNKVFGDKDDQRLEGFVPRTGPSYVYPKGQGQAIAISQPFRESAKDASGKAIKVTESEKRDLMRREKFLPDMSSHGQGEITSWYRPEDDVVITDAHNGNFIKLKDGSIVPIDLPISQLPKGTVEKEFGPRPAALSPDFMAKFGKPKGLDVNKRYSPNALLSGLADKLGPESVHVLNEIHKQLKNPDGTYFSPDESKTYLEGQEHPKPLLGDKIANFVRGLKALGGSLISGSFGEELSDLMNKMAAKHGLKMVDYRDFMLNPQSRKGVNDRGIFTAPGAGQVFGTDKMSPEQKELAFKISAYADKKYEELKDSGIGDVKKPEDLGITDDMPFDQIMKTLDNHYGHDQWLIKTTKVGKSHDGAGEGVQSAEQLKKNFQEDPKKITNNFQFGHFFFMKRFNTADQTREEREGGHLITPGSEYRVHVVYNNKGKAKAIPYATVKRDRGIEVHKMIPNSIDDADTYAAERAAEEAANKIPFHDRNRVLRGLDMIKTEEGDFQPVEFNPQGLDDQSGYWAAIPSVQDAFISSLKGELPHHARAARILLKSLARGDKL